MFKRSLVFALALALLLASASGARAESKAAFYGLATLDVLIVRPLGVVATVVGVALFVPAALVSAPSGKDEVNDAWQVFVTTPAEHVSARPLGEF